jgi:hypothetical protein
MSTPVSFSALKRSRGSVEKLTAAIQQATQGKKEDERFWEPTVDKAGNGHAVIRFLPSPPQDGEDGLPWVRSFSHGFQGPGGWLIELCPTTLERKCPVCEGNNVLWNSGIESNKEVARARKRKLSYTANILVISDPAKPENDGKVKLFRFGKKIFDKMYEKMHPEFPDEVAFNPSDLWDGANFKLKIRKVEGYRNYDKSEFAASGPIAEKDEDLERIWKSEYSLKEIVDTKNFKTYEQIEARRARVLGTSVSGTTAESVSDGAFNDEDVGIKIPARTNDPVTPPVAGDEEDDLKFFRSLAEDEA